MPPRSFTNQSTSVSDKVARSFHGGTSNLGTRSLPPRLTMACSRVSRTLEASTPGKPSNSFWNMDWYKTNTLPAQQEHVPPPRAFLTAYASGVIESSQTQTARDSSHVGIASRSHAQFPLSPKPLVSWLYSLLTVVDSVSPFLYRGSLTIIH